eukprot:3687357-Ditylum_brightwellii.AAC.1
MAPVGCQISSNNSSYNALTLATSPTRLIMDIGISWDANVAHDKIPSKFQYCAIMVIGPVLGKFAREVDKIHNSKNKMNP